jgi:hypothetical protein
MPSHNNEPILADNQPGELASTGYEPEYEEDVLKFTVPQSLTSDQAALAAEIVNLDHHSLNTLKPRTRERQEVKRLLSNAVNILQSGNDMALARLLYQKAETAYYHYLQARNRVRYLLGMVIGVLAAGAFGGVLVFIFGQHLKPFINAQLLVVLLLFAGMGSIASVLTRLSSIDLKQETSDFMIIISGVTRPVIAFFLR